MIILLKIFLGALVLAEILIGRFVITDFLRIRATEQFKEGTLYSQFITNVVFGFITISLIMLAIFLVWIIASPITIG